MFPNSFAACDPKSAARIYVAALCQMFPDLSAKLHRSLDFQIGIYPDQADKQLWMRQARLSFKAKVRNAYPQVSPEDYPSWPQIVPDDSAPSQTQEVEPATQIVDAEQSKGQEQEAANYNALNDNEAISALICEFEEAMSEKEIEVEVPEQSWLHHAELGNVLAQMDDQSALLREAAHQWTALLHRGFDLDRAYRCREQWQQAKEKLDELWQTLEVFANDVPAGERIELPRDTALDEELELLNALLQPYDETCHLDSQNCPDELQDLMLRLRERVDETLGAATLNDWLDYWLRADVADAIGLRDDLLLLRGEIETLCERTLEDELKSVTNDYKRSIGHNRSNQDESSERRNEIFCQRMGWHGEAARTLEDLSIEWRVSGERVRQIIKPLENWVAERHFFTPVLSRALNLVRQQLPMRAQDVTSLLQDSGITRGRWSLGALSDTARSLGQEPHFVLVTIEGTEKSQHLDLVWDGEDSASGKPLPQRVWQVMTTHIWERGIGYWPDLQREIADAEGEKALILAAIILENHAAVHWLDPSQEWFWLDATRVVRGQESRLFTPIMRALSVARRLSFSRLYAAVTRVHLHNTRLGYDWEMPPQHVFETWCASQSHFNTENGEVEMRNKSHWREVLDNTEATMVEIMEGNGPLLSRYNFRQLAVARGIAQPTFYIYVDNFPTIEEIDNGVFALIGAEITPQQLSEFHADYRNLPKRFQLRYGRLDDGHLWMSYRINQGTINNGSLALPKAMRGEFEGRYQLLNSHHVPVGTLSFNLMQCWGLRTYFDRQVFHGNRVTIIINKSHRQAVVFIGLDELPQPILNEVRDLEKIADEEE